MRQWLAAGILTMAIFSAPRLSAHSSLDSALATPQSGALGVLAQTLPPIQAGPHSIQTEGHLSSYTLPAELYRKAKILSRIHFALNLGSFAYGLFILWLILHCRLAPKYRDWAETLSSNRFIQSFVFTAPLILTVALLESPIAIYEHTVSRRYGLSVEGWSALLWDWTKGIALLILIGSLLAWILYWTVQRSRKRWWFYFWLISLPIILFMSFVEPLVLEPIFFKFEPLQAKDVELVNQIERVVQRSGLSIPANRIYWMKASDKTPLMNAYVSGLGASKRIVVWDTTIEKESASEIIAVVGHEMGHYVLGHVWKGLVFSMILMLILFYLGSRSLVWALARWRQGWGIRALDDWASLPALLLVLSIFSFLSDPISNAYSRHTEHQADQYGLEVTHGILPNAGQTAAESFQLEGTSALADPDPSPLNIFLFYDHPPISDRVRFCLDYNPWAEGKHAQFVK